MHVEDRQRHRPGQHYLIRLRAPDDYTAQRSYSVASDDRRPAASSSSSRSCPDGEVSEFLADVAEVGDVLEMRGPIGRWFIWDTRTPALCLVGGTGVVPAVAMTRAARRLGRTDLLRVVAVGRGPDELPYADELGRYGATLAFTRQGTDHRPAGPPTADEVEPLLAGVELAYVCGSSRFVEFATPLLLECGSSRPRSGSSSSARPADGQRRTRNRRCVTPPRPRAPGPDRLADPDPEVLEQSAGRRPGGPGRGGPRERRRGALRATHAGRWRRRGPGRARHRRPRGPMRRPPRGRCRSGPAASRRSRRDAGDATAPGWGHRRGGPAAAAGRLERAATGDDRAGGQELAEHDAVHLRGGVVERPLVQTCAAVAETVVVGLVRTGDEPVERHGHVEDGGAHGWCSLLVGGLAWSTNGPGGIRHSRRPPRVGA